MIAREARFGLGDVVRHRLFPFRGVVIDVDPEYDNTEEWWMSIPEAIRPSKDQPFYHLLAENAESTYTAYVSEQNLLPDAESGPVNHPDLGEVFDAFDGQAYRVRSLPIN
ncbi:MAG: heat shock protein HspQ [Maricaulaceae bacterium]